MSTAAQGPRLAAAAAALLLLCHSAQAQDKAAVSVTPTTARAGEWITVHYEVPSHELKRNTSEYICNQDIYCDNVWHLSAWVGLFTKGTESPRRIPPQTCSYANPPWVYPSPVKWKPVNATSGSVTFQLFAARAAEMEVILFGNGSSYPVHMATSEPIVMADAKQPRHVHIARVQNHSMMSVQWEIISRVTDTIVRWGTSQDDLASETPSRAPTTYSKEDLCGPPANSIGWSPVPWFYEAVIGPFPPTARRIFYQLGSAEAGWTDVNSFAAPQPPSRLQRLTVAVVADTGEASLDGAQYHWMEPFAINTTNFVLADLNTPGHANLALNPHGGARGNSGKEGPGRGKALASLGAKTAAAGAAGGAGGVDLVLHLGDLAYATGYESEWDFFMSMVEPIAKQVPYMTCMGNHERDTKGSGMSIGGDDSGGECGVPTQARFRMPTPGRKADKGWYSFRQGPVFFLMMDSEQSAAAGSDQYAFFEAELKTVNRTVTPWVVFGGHRPMYSSGGAPSPLGYNEVDGPWWQDLEDLLIEYSVDLCMWGHNHNAEITCPLQRGKCVYSPTNGYDSPVHVIAGNGGQSLSGWAQSPEWSIWRAVQFGYVILKVEGPTRLVVNFYADCNWTPSPADGPNTNCSQAHQLVHSQELRRAPGLWTDQHAPPAGPRQPSNSSQKH